MHVAKQTSRRQGYEGSSPAAESVQLRDMRGGRTLVTLEPLGFGVCRSPFKSLVYLLQPWWTTVAGILHLYRS